jgi:hypothetical protein
MQTLPPRKRIPRVPPPNPQSAWRAGPQPRLLNPAQETRYWRLSRSGLRCSRRSSSFSG